MGLIIFLYSSFHPALFALFCWSTANFVLWILNFNSHLRPLIRQWAFALQVFLISPVFMWSFKADSLLGFGSYGRTWFLVWVILLSAVGASYWQRALTVKAQ